MRIGILQTDSVRDEFQPRFGDYPAMFTRVLTHAANTRSPPIKLTIHTIDVRNEPLPAQADCDGYVITGSKHSAYEDLPWIPPLIEFLKKAIQAQRKIVGICFGHQLIAHYFGGETRPAEAGWAVGVQQTRMLKKAPWMSPARESVGLLSSHKDQVSRLPPGAELIASTPFCPISGYVIGDEVLALQGHPEFVKDYSASLMDMRRELLGDETHHKGVQSLAEDTDEDVVAHWILNFIGGSSS